jgi:hypothetical protein
MRKARINWTRFERGVLDIDEDKFMADYAGHPAAEVRRQLEKLRADEVWINSIYQVNIDRAPDAVQPGFAPMIHLSIKRRDKSAVHDWRDLQRIKNELVGPEHEAMELYPAEARLVDTANQYHLWVLANPDDRIPFGWTARAVDSAHPPGGRQRPR